MVVKHNYTIICEYAIVDQRGKQSLIGIVRNVEFAEFPGAVVQLHIMTNLSNAEGKTFFFAMLDPSGKELFRTDAKIIDDPYSPASQYTQKGSAIGMTLSPAIFYKEGVHRIVVYVDGKAIHKEPLGVYTKVAKEDDASV